MTKEAYLKLAASKWNSIEALQTEKDFYVYEKKFDSIMVELGREVLEGSISEVPKDRRKKKKPTPDMDK